jgi:hypothetical protein
MHIPARYACHGNVKAAKFWNEKYKKLAKPLPNP